MRKIKFIIVNDTSSPTPTSSALSSIASDFRHSHLVDATDLSRPDLTKVLLLARHHYPSAKILGLSEISGKGIIASDSMNKLRRELSDLP